MTQQIRLSQFVVTYGPGAILEGANGPRIIPRADKGLFPPGQSLTPATFEISDQRMSAGLLEGARIFRLPSNAELGRGARSAVYRTKPFPTQSLCLNSDRHPTAPQQEPYGVLYWGGACPVCRSTQQRRKEAIRFVVACPLGHLDEVNWSWVVHSATPPQQSGTCPHQDWFRWYGGGGALSNVVLECPVCGIRASLGRAYGQSWRCTGRYPEREDLSSRPLRPGCPADARMIQRQASNLRLPELQTLFTIPPRYTQLHTVLQSAAIHAMLAVVASMGLITQQAFETQLAMLVQLDMVPTAVANQIRRHPWSEIQQAIDDVLDPVQPGYRNLLLEEYRALLTASLMGAPPVHGPAPNSHPVFAIDRNLVRRIPGPNGRVLRITPITRLRTVTVQIGYRRELPHNANTPPGPAPVTRVSFEDDANQRWYPGTQFLGEGIFISLDADDGWHFPLIGGAAAAWEGAGATAYPAHLFRDPATDELHPIFVWWHTLAHLLLRALGVDAGYSSTAIRERVYIETAPNGRARGGVVLYATQPGVDGTLGGLIALVPQFQRVLDRATDAARVCSNDPLCSDHRFGPGHSSGASCYGCTLVSETSCEHRNLWLDRDLLLQNLP